MKATKSIADKKEKKRQPALCPQIINQKACPTTVRNPYE